MITTFIYLKNPDYFEIYFNNLHLIVDKEKLYRNLKPLFAKNPDDIAFENGELLVKKDFIVKIENSEWLYNKIGYFLMESVWYQLSNNTGNRKLYNDFIVKFIVNDTRDEIAIFLHNKFEGHIPYYLLAPTKTHHYAEYGELPHCYTLIADRLSISEKNKYVFDLFNFVIKNG